MASTMPFSFRFSYRRLKQEGGDAVEKKAAWRLRSSSGSFRLRKRLRIKIPRLTAMRRLLRKKARVVVAACARTAKRLKESKSHLGDLFAGYYLFLQVTPTAFKSQNPNKSLQLLHRSYAVTSVIQKQNTYF